MTWTQALLQLQDLDHILIAHHKRLREIELALQDSAALLEAEKRAARTAKTAQAARKRQQDLEFEMGQVQVKRDLTENNLYSGRITNSRELQDLQAELQSLKRRVADLEDQVLEAMMAREEADANAAGVDAQLEELQQLHQDTHATLIAERQTLLAENQTLQAQQQQLRAAILPEALESYDYLKDRTGNLPVAQLHGDVCSVCGTEVLRPTQQKVHRGQVAYCDTCLRLLVE